ncbi:Mediator of RNA polymerase II transcription subunit 21-like isoform X1 [Oopsacas minuta]|uniref:Mediator of RNA polymerase II transcription subunit 21 n=1 Tax=Oopsacas minuta TaxID=111878 RepID=A0AAV7KF73_9METZ|nr:Mediator of RNA polymerase II transcription subunit 21-like isoform X1 [Oopsacas minuta]
MADRITQLQQAIHLLADHFCNSVGLLQQAAELANPQAIRHLHDNDPSPLPQIYSRCISRTSYDICTIIESLPTLELKLDNHFIRLQSAIITNDERAKQLILILNIAKDFLLSIRNAQTKISDLQLTMFKEF